MAKAALGPYSPFIKTRDYVFTSGQVGFVDPGTGNDIQGIENQTRECFSKLKTVLESAGASFDDVVKVTVFLKNVDDFAAMNKIYAEYFTGELPARSTVIAGLVNPKMLIEIECIACVTSGKK